MKKTIVLVLLVASIAWNHKVFADTFGVGANQFTIDFTSISNPNNAPDVTGFGSVPYDYKISIYEISSSMVYGAIAAGLSDVTTGPWSDNQPAANMSWHEAAAFVNWLNASKGYQTAYNLSYDNGWTMQLWDTEQAWQLGGENLFRHKDAFYFLPSENEWYKAAYHKNDGVTGNYWLYPTASDNIPTPVVSGTDSETAVFGGLSEQPADVFASGGLSAYATIGQGGNVFEWTETAYSGVNNDPDAARSVRGDDYDLDGTALASTERGSVMPISEQSYIGFRVASVPEPSTYALLLLGGASLWFLNRRKRSKS
jgi:formylglycine-generating enzyme required for sulfatase activity